MPLSEILDLARLKPQARYAMFRCADTMDQGGDDSEAADEGGTDGQEAAGNANPRA